MNPSFECPASTPLEEMTTHINKHSTAAAITDSQFRIKVINSIGIVLFGTDDGTLVSLIHPDDYVAFQRMRVGQICRAELNTSKKELVTVTRFEGYFLFCHDKPLSAYVPQALEIKNESERLVGEVEEFYARAHSGFNKVGGGISTLRNRQLLRQMNASKMLDMVSSVSVRSRQIFEPSAALIKSVHHINEVMGPRGVHLNCDAAPSPYSCCGERADFCTVVATMASIAAENSYDGKISLKTSYGQYRYCIQYDFRLISNNRAETERVKEKLSFVNCIADSNGWFVHSEVNRSRMRMYLIMPCNEDKQLWVKAPTLTDNMDLQINIQLMDLEIPNYKNTK